MNRKIKIILTAILTIIIAMSVKNISYGVQAVSNATHPDPYLGGEELLNQGQWFCKEKGGALRFTPSTLQTGKVTGTLKTCQSASTSLYTAYETATRQAILKAVEESVPYYKPAPVSSTIFARYSNNTFNITDKKTNTSGRLPCYSYPYATTPDYTPGDTVKNKNDRISYIISAHKKWRPNGNQFNFRKGNHQVSISDQVEDSQAIQDALWCTKKSEGFNKGKQIKQASFSNDLPYQLYKEAINYEKFYKSTSKNKGLANGNISTVKKNLTSNIKNAQVIVENRENYIIGPIKITYPYSATRESLKFFYVEDMKLITNDGKTIRPTVITENGNSYPNSNEYFYLKFNAKDAGYPTSVKLSVDYAYLANCSSEYTVYTATDVKIQQLKGEIVKNTLKEVCGNEGHYVTNYKKDDNGYDVIDPDTGEKVVESITYCYKVEAYGNITTVDIGTYKAQELAKMGDSSRKWKEIHYEDDDKWIDLTMKLGGRVWEDKTEGDKETEGNNEYHAKDANNKKEDNPMPNVIVTLYQVKPNGNTKKIKETKTDKNGKYEFKELNSMYQYYVEFTYNSQYYQPVKFVSPGNDTNGFGKGNWNVNSNGTDVRKEREEINARFASIGSSPANYKVGNRTNKTYSKDQLLGKTLDMNGNLSQTGYAVIDEFGNLLYNNNNELIVKDKNGNTKKVSALTGKNKTDIESKIQYVKDCQLNSYTGKDKKQDDGKYERKNNLYPTYKTFVIDDVKKAKIKTILGNDFYNKVKTLYDANMHINQGYVKREEAHIIVQKEIQKVVLEINGQEHTYNYDQWYKNKKDKVTADYDNYWTVPERLQRGYYYMGPNDSRERFYTREIYESDYLYKVDMYGAAKEELGKKTSDELEVYVTYRIMINNSSQSIRTRIDEIVDYYDTDFDFVPDRSYMKIEKGTDVYKYGLNTALDNSTMYTAQGTKTTINGYNNLYISKIGNNANLIDGDSSKLETNNSNGMYLYSGDTANVFLTFKVKKDAQRNVLIDEYNNQDKNNTKIGKGNVVELNGYSTIYGKGTNVANVGDVSGKPAGIVDKASNPGNLEDDTVLRKEYNKFEDDTDKAPPIKIKVVSALSREISGTVWEDERTSKVQGAIVGDGEKDNKFINGVTVQLVEITSNGKEFVWREFGGKSKDANGYTYGQTGNGIGSGLVETETAIIGSTFHTFDKSEQNQGKYIFTGFMPGKYIVRFIYGDTEKTIIPGICNVTSYNGQDYKSTTYQKGVDQNSSYEWNRWKWDSKTEEFVKDGNTITTISGYKSDYSNNETAITAFTNDNKAYLYDIAKSQGKNVSDAKDIESRRNQVNDYSDNNIRNHIAEVLAVPDSKDSNLLQELIDNTKMTAETGLIVMEFEYNTKTTDNQDDENSLTYVVSDVDLGLEERPKAQLVIDKEVTNMKLTLADGSTLFDARQTATNVAWKDHKEYKTGYENNRMKEIDEKIVSKERLGLIQVSMDEELMHGAKIRITYNVKVRNVGEIDYKENQFYYTGTVKDKGNVVKTKANTVIDYVANNLQFDKQETENTNWNVIKKDAITSNTNNDFVNYRLKDKVAQFNTIIYTNSLSGELVPELYKQKIDNNNNNNSASEVSVPLTLSQLITAENDTDDLTYENIVEIVETSNTVGRRMAYSVVGNQDPTADQPSEADSDIAESVKILPPFGNGGLYIIIATTIMIVMAILAGGIIFIKKKVIK